MMARSKHILTISILQALWSLAEMYSTSNSCSRGLDFPQLTLKKFLDVDHFLTLNASLVLECVRACQLRSICVSINYNSKTFQCLLNSKNSSDPSAVLQGNTDFVTSDISLWPQTLAEGCRSHSCPYNTSCQQLNDGGTRCVQESWLTTSAPTTSTSTPTTTAAQPTTPSSYAMNTINVTLDDGTVTSVPQIVFSQMMTYAEIEDLIKTHHACLKNCTRAPSGTYQSCDGCTKFIACSNENLSNMSCPSSLKWDQTIQNCARTSQTCFH